jgi:hypothetical protein
MGLAAARSQNLEHLINWLGGEAKVTLMTARRFPAPWTVEEYRGISYITSGSPLVFWRFSSEPVRLTRELDVEVLFVRHKAS